MKVDDRYARWLVAFDTSYLLHMYTMSIIQQVLIRQLRKARKSMSSVHHCVVPFYWRF